MPFKPPEIETFQDFDRRLGDAIHRVDQLLIQFPNDATLEGLHRQLEAAFTWTRGGTRPADNDLARLNFGMIASRELSDVDGDFCSELSALNSYLDVWPPGVIAPRWP